MLWLVPLIFVNFVNAEVQADFGFALDASGQVDLIHGHLGLSSEDPTPFAHGRTVRMEDTKERTVSTESGDPTAKLFAELVRDAMVWTAVLALAAFAHKMMKKHAKEKQSSKPVKQNRGTSIALNKNILALPTAEIVLDYATKNVARMDIVNVVTALHQSVKLDAKQRVSRSDPRVAKLLAQLVVFLQAEGTTLELGRRAVSTTAWSLARMRRGGTEEADEFHAVADALVKYFVDHTAEFSPEQLTRVLSAFSDLRYARVEVAEAACRISAQWSTWPLRDLVYVAWSLARLAQTQAVRGSPDVAAALRALPGQIGAQIGPQLVAPLGLAGPPGLAPPAAQSLGSLSGKLVGMLAWALAQLKIADIDVDVSDVLTAVADDVVGRGLTSFLPGEMCSVVWALSKCGDASHPLFSAVRDRAILDQFRGYKAQDLANIACSFVHMKRDDDSFLAQLGIVIERQGKSFSDLERQMVRWAYAQRSYLMAPKFK